MKNQIITWVIALTCGGLGGAFFNQGYVNRSTVIRYSVTKSVLGGDSASSTVVPDFRLQVGDQAIRALWIHTIRLEFASGPEIENAAIGIHLSKPVKLLGRTITRDPGEALHINCDPFVVRPDSSATLCKVRRFNSNVGAYDISFATDGDTSIGLSIDYAWGQQ